MSQDFGLPSIQQVGGMAAKSKKEHAHVAHVIRICGSSDTQRDGDAVRSLIDELLVPALIREYLQESNGFTEDDQSGRVCTAKANVK